MVRLERTNVSVHRSLIAPAILIAALACGCKSSSWMTRPTWLGGSPPPASSLSSAPAFDKGIAKPSETAKPYPTTSTPESYVLNNGTRTDAPSATRSPSSTPTAVTYGAKPQPSSTATAAAPAITPQVGPYAPVQQTPYDATPSDPAAAVTSGFAAAPAFAGGNAAPPASPTPPQAARFADASGGASGWTPPPSTPAQAASISPGMSAFPPTSQPDPTDSGYGSGTSSRFSTGFQPPQAPASTEQQPQWSAPPPSTPSSLSPPSTSTPEATLPGLITPPTRRPDPGYRPGGTSSYRPAKTLLAGEEEEAAVQPTSFQSAPQ